MSKTVKITLTESVDYKGNVHVALNVNGARYTAIEGVYEVTHRDLLGAIIPKPVEGTVCKLIKDAGEAHCQYCEKAIEADAEGFMQDPPNARF